LSPFEIAFEELVRILLQRGRTRFEYAPALCSELALELGRLPAPRRFRRARYLRRLVAHLARNAFGCLAVEQRAGIGRRSRGLFGRERNDVADRQSARREECRHDAERGGTSDDLRRFAGLDI
jgi:hypothetical protein